MNPTETLRLFLAIQIPEPIRLELHRLQHELQPLLPPGVARWTGPEQLHLTLKFLGNVPESNISVLNDAALAVCAATPPLQLQMQGTGFFPNEFSPRIFWADVKSLALQKFQQQLETAVEPFTQKHESKKFSAHVTLARFEKMRRRDVEKLMAHAQTSKTFGQWTAHEVELVQSKLKQTGAVYATVAVYRTKSEYP